MKILVDIGHPAHVHYFRNLIGILEKDGVEFRVLARDKEVTYDLLRAYGIPYTSKGPGGRAFFDRVDYTMRSLILIGREVRSFNPDLCISFFSPYLSLISAWYKLPHIMFNDTENQLLFRLSMKIFSARIYSPESFIKPDKDHQVLIPSFMELAYLHPDVYSPDSSICEFTGEDYILLRFVSDKASHDLGNHSINKEEKIKMYRQLAQYKKVWISSEDPLPDELIPYRLTVPPEKIHDVIAHASLLIGGSGTMSSEAAMLGVPSIFIHDNELGYIKELNEKYGLVYQYPGDSTGIELSIKKAISILANGISKTEFLDRRDKMLKEKKNMTNEMIDIVKSHF